jgi:four helix bundle protein
MTYEKFEDLPAWQSAAKLYNRVLDLLEEHGPLFSPGYRGQLDRAALSISNNIAEGFERVTTRELNAFLDIARGSAGEVRSMMAVIKNRPKIRPARLLMSEISGLADDCIKQITGWIKYLDASEVQGKRHLTPLRREQQQTATAAKKYRLDFLRKLKPNHPLYNTEEARAARGNQ